MKIRFRLVENRGHFFHGAQNRLAALRIKWRWLDERFEQCGERLIQIEGWVALPAAVRQAHPDGVDVLIDLVDADAAGFAALASLVRPGGTAMSTNYVADEAVLRASGVTGINFALPMSSDLLARLAEAVIDGRIVTPPITRISLEEVPAALNPAQGRPARGKTVIAL